MKADERLEHALADRGEAGGFLYYVMPHLQGETIRGPDLVVVLNWIEELKRVLGG